MSTASPSQWGRILSIQVPRARFDAVRADVLRDLRKRLVRPGFRPGKVPTAIVEREFADRIQSSTIERFIPDVADEAIRQESLDVISQPRIDNLVLDDPETVRFELAVEVRPEIELRPLEGLRGTRWTAAVTEEHVGRTLEDVREQHASYVTVEREARDGDFVQVAYVPLDDAGTEQTDRKVENYPFQLGGEGGVPAFEAAVRGQSAGATVRATVDYPAEHGDADLAGKSVAFLLTLSSVKEKRLPDLDDDLAKDLGLESLAVLRERVRADLERRVREESERDLRESLVDGLIQANAFEAPASMVDQYLDAVLADWEGNYKRMGVEPEAERRQEFARAARPAAERAVKRQLLLERVAREHAQTVSEEDVDKWIEDKVQAGGPGASEVRAFFADARRRRRLRSELTEDKVFEFLKSKAEIDEITRPSTQQDAG